MCEQYSIIEETIIEKANNLALERHHCLLEELPTKESVALWEEAETWVINNVSFTDEEFWED